MIKDKKNWEMESTDRISGCDKRREVFWIQRDDVGLIFAGQ
jgi:hypothetical protein